MLNRALNKMLTSTTDPRPLAIVRIIFGFLVMAKTLDLADRVFEISGDPSPPQFIEALPTLMLGTVPYALIVAWPLAGLAILLGWQPRAASAAVSAMALYIILADERLYNQHLYLILSVAFVMSFARSDAALALGRRNAKAVPIPAWPVTLLKMQVSIVYAFAATAKLTEDYLSGYVVAAAVQYRPFGTLIGFDKIDSMYPFATVSVLALCVEGSLAWLLWVRPRIGALVGIGFHTSMLFLMTENFLSFDRLLVFGGLITMIYVLFLSNDVVQCLDTKKVRTSV